MDAKSVEKELLELETRFWQAIKDRDADVAGRLTEDPCIVAGAQGISRMDPKALAGMMENANYALHDFKIDPDVEVSLLRDDVAVLAYKVQEKLAVDGEPVDLEAAESSVWVRRDGKWRCALHTESIAGDPFGRDRQPAAARRERAGGRQRSPARE